MNRARSIIKTSIISAGVNAALGSVKLFIGTASRSVDITADAVNNLTDALEEGITIAGMAFSQKRPNKKHPLGYGRIEYLGTILIACLIVYAGLTALIESGKKILHPEIPQFTPTALCIIAGSIAVKLVLALWTKKQARRLDAKALAVSGQEAINDVLVAASTLVSALLNTYAHVNISSYLGLAISIIILKSGLEMLWDAVSIALGERTPPALSRAVKQTIAEVPGVLGVFDLILTAYGAETVIGSVHIEVSDTISVNALTKIEHDIVKRVREKHHIVLTGISVYARNTKSATARRAYESVKTIVSTYPQIRDMHGFYLDPERCEINFDLVPEFSTTDPEAVVSAIKANITEALPDFHVEIVLDRDVSD